jgi:hypothetical protein
MAEAMFDLARSHFRAKRTAAAAGAFSSALAFSARSGRGLDAAQREMAHSMRGDCHTILGRFQEAEGDFSSSIELAPGVAVYYYKRGSARRKLAQHEGAVADLRRSVEMGCGLGKAELRQLEALSAGRAEATAASQDRSARTDGKANKTSRARSHGHRTPNPASRSQHETAEAEAVRAQLEVVQREQARLASLTARVVSAALTNGERERSGRLAAEQAVEVERQRVELAVAKARQERDRAKSERRAAKRANAVAQANFAEATQARADAAEQRERVSQYLLCAQAEIAAAEREARQHAAAMAKQSDMRDAARQEQAARQQAAATAVLRKERAARAAAAEAQARAEDRLLQAEAELTAAQQAAALAAAGAHAATVGHSTGGSGGECVVCLDSPREMMLEPCRHVCLCAACALRVSHCPVCRAKVARRVRLYM